MLAKNTKTAICYQTSFWKALWLNSLSPFEQKMVNLRN